MNVWPPETTRVDEREDRLGTVRLTRVAKPRCVDVTLEVIDPDQRPIVDPGEGLGEVDPDEQRARQAGAVGDRDRLDVVPGRAGIVPRRVEDRDDPAQMGTRGHLRHDPAGRGVEGDL